MRIGWVVQSMRFDLASARYRCHYPAYGLSLSGHESAIFEEAADAIAALVELDVLVIVKRLDPAVIEVAAMAHQARVPVVFDLCDDVISPGYRGEGPEFNLMVLTAISRVADLIVTTGNELSERVRNGLLIATSIVEIPDANETRELTEATQNALLQSAAEARIRAAHLARAVRDPIWGFRKFSDLAFNSSASAWMRAQMRKSSSQIRRRRRERPTAPGHQKIVWFGNSGGPHANYGVLSLLSVADILRRIYAERPFELVVVSSDEKKFGPALDWIGVPLAYVQWSTEAVYQELAGAAAALLTTGDDRFSHVKSANRAVLALSAGVPVVSPPHSSLEPLAGCVATDVEAGLRRYLSDPKSAAADVAKARIVIEREFSLSAICARWESALAKASTRAHSRHERVTGASKLLFVIDLMQDLDVLLPVIDAALARGLLCNIIVSARAARESGRVVEALIARKLIPTMIDDADLADLDARWLRDSDALVTAAESSLYPHRIAHQLTRLANAFHLQTASIQHGYEAPGLTFELTGPSPSIAAQTIFTWQDPKELPASTAKSIRRRCIGVGRASSLQATPTKARAHAPSQVVGVFENLHWERYTDDYRKAFVRQFKATARKRPDLTFLVRPHPAGRWLLANWPKTLTPNVELTKADQPLAAILPDLIAVITTPSSVAVDGAESGKPVAVFRGDLPELPLYEPLPLLRNEGDWLAFLAAAEAGSCDEATRTFFERAVLPGDAAQKILDHLCMAEAHLSGARGETLALSKRSRPIGRGPQGRFPSLSEGSTQGAPARG